MIENYFPAYQLCPITLDNYQDVMPIYHSNQAFFMAVDGTPGTLEGCRSNIAAVPPNFPLSQKQYFGLWQNSHPIAMVDILQGYPSANVLYIGLLLVHGDYHGQGIGQSIVENLLAFAKDNGITEAQLGVIKSNYQAIAFWEKCGFKQTGATADAITMSRKV